MQHIKYQKIKHLPWSPGVQSDDKIEYDLKDSLGTRVVWTEKVDGENTTMYRDGIHARSLDGSYHPSQAWVKALHGSIAHLIPENMRICGENVYAVHSIKYNELPSYFLVFGIYQDGICLSWPETERICGELGLQTVPVIDVWIFDKPRFAPSMDPKPSLLGAEEAEGFVIRPYYAFLEEETNKILKWVRPNHVQTKDHWAHGSWQKNELSKNVDRNSPDNFGDCEYPTGA